jgi:hypothetical protein
MQYVELCFEGTNPVSTAKIVCELMRANIGYAHITGQTGNLVGQVTIGYDKFKSAAETIVHKHNGGLWCNISEVAEDKIEHLL